MMWYRAVPFALGGSGQAQLEVQGLSAGYGAFLVLRELQLEVKPGLTVILGPNGAGKITLEGLAASCHAAAAPLDDEAPDRRSDAGIALVPEGRQLVPQMTVEENLELGGWLLSPEERAKRLVQAFEDFPKLRERAQQLAGTMSGGEQQMVAVARAMISAPRLLMLDEPSIGLAPVVERMLAPIVRIADAGTTVLMVDRTRKALAVRPRPRDGERSAGGPAGRRGCSHAQRHSRAYSARDGSTAAEADARPPPPAQPGEKTCPTCPCSSTA
jgi:branched-chain amino acid transport system ATP-binding protein